MMIKHAVVCGYAHLYIEKVHKKILADKNDMMTVISHFKVFNIAKNLIGGKLVMIV